MLCNYGLHENTVLHVIICKLSVMPDRRTAMPVGCPDTTLWTPLFAGMTEALAGNQRTGNWLVPRLLRVLSVLPWAFQAQVAL